MTTAHDGTSLGQFMQGGVKYPEGQGRFGIVHFHVNIATLVTQLGVAIDPATDDTIDIWDIPIGVQITGALLHVRTAATTTAAAGTATVMVGDALTSTGVDVEDNGYIAATDLKTVAYTGTVVGDHYGAATKVYSVEHLLRLTTAGTATALLTGIFDLYLFCFFADIPGAEPSSWK